MVENQTHAPHPAPATDRTASGTYLPALTLALMAGILLLACVLALVATVANLGGTGTGTPGVVLVGGVAAVAAVAVALVLVNAARARNAERSGTARRAGLPLMAAAVLVPLATVVLAAVVGGLDWPGSAGLVGVALPCGGLAFVGLATWTSNRRPIRLLDQPASPRRVAGFLAMLSAMPLSLVVISLMSALTGEQEAALTGGAVLAGLAVSALVLINLVRALAPTAPLAGVARLLVAVLVLAAFGLAIVLLVGASPLQGWALVVAGCLLTGWAWIVFLAMATYETASDPQGLQPAGSSPR